MPDHNGLDSGANKLLENALIRNALIASLYSKNKMKSKQIVTIRIT
jgi:hypothetical protein